jgi:hypothetical protein
MPASHSVVALAVSGEAGGGAIFSPLQRSASLTHYLSRSDGTSPGGHVPARKAPMGKEATLGAAAFLAIATLVGFGLQSGTRQQPGETTDQGNRRGRSERAAGKSEVPEKQTPCSGLEGRLKEFLNTDVLPLPSECYEGGPEPRSGAVALKNAPQLKFIVATLPDPLHTHLSFLFDQFTAAIQEGAQDEKYDFDNAWLPWPDGEQAYSSLQDQDVADKRKGAMEEQPGIIFFREATECRVTDDSQGSANGSTGGDREPCGHRSQLRNKLIVFVVGEDATHGIHRQQFRNALAWVEKLRPFSGTSQPEIGIVGPTFSGSLPSLAQLLSEEGVNTKLNLQSQPLPIFSGSASGKESVEWFRSWFTEDKEHKSGGQTRGGKEQSVVFHSFVQSDDLILSRFCKYMQLEQSAQRIAVISEDETAYGKYGSSGGEPEKNVPGCPGGAVQLFYPRDISALRRAYQAKGIFDGGQTQSGETQRTNLPGDLADPSNPGSRIHDSIPSYGGDLTPLNQEAFLLEIVAALRELHTRYILLRSSSALDQLFLTNFLRRMYPNGRIVIMGADLVFPRERGATALSGTMTLSTYPLFPLARDWTEHRSLPASDRVFSADTAEATYIAFRLLLNEKKLNNGSYPAGKCHVSDSSETGVFVPAVVCSQDPPIPDYSPPRWTYSNLDGSVQKDEPFFYPGPPTWLSVIGGNQFWPLASLTGGTAPKEDHPSTPGSAGVAVDGPRQKEPGEIPEMPIGIKVFLILLAAFAVFHAWCCWSGSYTGKPSFRAFFATTEDKLHLWLMFLGSCCVAFLGIVAGWGCGVFAPSVYGLRFPLFALFLVVLVCAMSFAAVYASNVNAWKLSGGQVVPTLKPCWFFLAVLAAFVLTFVVPIELVLNDENRILTYWRSMHLASGVSPLMPLISLLVGFYAWLWFALHGLALFGPDRPCLPTRKELALKDAANGRDLYVLRMFSQEEMAVEIEKDAMPVTWKTAIGIAACLLLLAITGGIARGVPVRSLGAQVYAAILLLWLVVCGSLMVGGAWQLNAVWAELRRLLAFLDRLALRRTLAALRGFSWGTVWKMSGNVLEVRYKLISRQMESMNHTIASLEDFEKKLPDSGDLRVSRQSIEDCLGALRDMRNAGLVFAEWYSQNYRNSRAGDMTTFGTFQRTVATATGTLLAHLLVPAWRLENKSLVLAEDRDGEKDNPCIAPPLAEEEHIRNVEEFVCLTYMGFIQNILGRLRTLAMALVALFIAATVALTTYPFDPRQVLSSILIALFIVIGVVMVKVYAEMHRDATLSHVTNTRPGELGPEFWIKIVGFGVAPLIGLLTRIFPGITEFVFSWLQPGLSSLK